ncbi:MAG: zinc-binding alcohol dehydrogenase [Rhizorhabdus sp.]|nr:zinc-binding alcohol dehydrogenase [Rhizorhabdus sp.]
MKAALVIRAGQPPIYGDFAEPAAARDEALVTVTAAALSPLVRARASGKHYSSSGGFPFVAGVDGVGTLEDGTRVYFLLPRAPYGAMAERTVVPLAQCVALPVALDDVTAAAIANPGMSSWAAFTERGHLGPGETVLINGATGASGRLAVQIARHMGAGKVIATGRNARILADLGADATIGLGDTEQAIDSALVEQFAQGIDVVIDYLWGKSAE